jgi:hypothetical protein
LGPVIHAFAFRPARIGSSATADPQGPRRVPQYKMDVRLPPSPCQKNYHRPLTSLSLGCASGGQLDRDLTLSGGAGG